MGELEEVARDDSETASAPEEGSWEFNEEVATVFEDMLARSIPNYADMRRVVTDVSTWLLDRAGNDAQVVDIGCSRGSALRPIVDRVGVRAKYVGLEISDPMIDAAVEEFVGWESFVRIEKWDLREGLPEFLRPSTVALSVLTLQFVPIEYRQRLLGDIAANLIPGVGGLVLVEKVLGSSPALQEIETDIYHDLKRGNGYTQEAIDRKRYSLEGRLVPLTAAFNEELLRGAGFRDVDCIWSWANFRGWLALV